jgi:hypothetical protein
MLLLFDIIIDDKFPAKTIVVQMKYQYSDIDNYLH